jgi:Cytochrome B561
VGDGRVRRVAPGGRAFRRRHADPDPRVLAAALRNEHGAPKPPATGPGWSRTAARALHLAFYGLLVLLPVTGALAWGMPSAAMGQAHEVLRVLLILAILAHVGAALLHQFVWKDATLRRMVDPVD